LELAGDQAKPKEGDDSAGARSGHGDKASDYDQDPAPDAQKHPGIELAAPVFLVPPVTVLETVALLALLELPPVLSCSSDHATRKPARNYLSSAFYHRRGTDGLNPGYMVEEWPKTCKRRAPRGATAPPKPPALA
jgi:hypothetical protein